MKLAGAMFRGFYNHLAALGLIVHEGKMMGHKFRCLPANNAREENTAIKGWQDELWAEQAQQAPEILTRNGAESVTKRSTATKSRQGMRKTKLITGYDTTDASGYDSRRASGLLTTTMPRRNDTAGCRISSARRMGLSRKCDSAHMYRKRYRNILSQMSKASNRDQSKNQEQGRRVFGFIRRSMGGLVFRGVGI